MIVFRVSRMKYAADLQGIGGVFVPGRWNNIGTPIVYSSLSRSLAIMEYRVQFQDDTVPSNLAITEINIPDSVSQKFVLLTDLPNNWRSLPYSNQTQVIGDKFIQEQKFPVLIVPSALIPQESNVLINPNLVEANKISIVSVEPYEFDGRLFK